MLASTQSRLLPIFCSVPRALITAAAIVKVLNEDFRKYAHNTTIRK